MAGAAIGAHDRKLKVVHLLAAKGGGERIVHGRAAGGGNQFHQRAAQQLLSLIASRFVPAAVGITDQTGSIGHQDQALGIVQDLAGEIALAL